MRLSVLTTETLHHTYFVQELLKKYPGTRVFVETQTLKPSFSTSHPFEQLREEYEQKAFFNGAKPSLKDVSEVESFPTLNGDEAIRALRDFRAEVAVVFGTGRLSPPLIEAQGILINLHGGDPERYRGLDSHLWSIYHGEFDSLMTTLHHLNPVLDDGDIILKNSLLLHKGMKLHELRSVNTYVCLKMVKEALARYSNEGKIVGVPQKKKGRYYSFMPADLKEVCRNRFEKYTDRL
jgi:methionyl-tRNA formyltransferase